MSEGHEIVATLVRDEGGGGAFLADVGTMLQRIANRAAIVLELSTRRSDSRVFCLPRGLAVPETLVRELGTHRAQLVRPGPSAGRITTAWVVVTTVPDFAAPRIGNALKTYNYPLGRVEIHATGETASLAAVLDGRV